MIKPALTIILITVLTCGCGPPLEEDQYRTEGRFPGGLNVPVALLTVEWAGKVRIMGSAWLIDHDGGVLLSAKHVTDAFMNDIIELGGTFKNGLSFPGDPSGDWPEEIINCRCTTVAVLEKSQIVLVKDIKDNEVQKVIKLRQELEEALKDTHGL